MDQAHSSHSPIRSIGSVLAGLLVVVLLSTGTDMALHASGIYPPMFQPMSTSLWALATAYRFVYSILGGYITARLAPDRPLLHAMVLGTIGIVLSLAGTVATWSKGPEFGPKWYPIGLIVLAIPCSWAGARIRIMQLRARYVGRAEEA